MRREIHGWYSPSLKRHMEIVVYGHWGDALLMLPTAAADFLEYERFQMIDSIADVIESGKFKVFSVNSINNESWLNNSMLPHHKAIRQNDFNHYIRQEVVPFIKSMTSQSTHIFTTGASLGATHAANLFFKYPDVIAGTIAMSGIYDLTYYTKGYWDDNVYFNSPVHYLPNMHDDWYLSNYRLSHHIHFVTGSGAYEDPGATHHICDILHGKNIWYSRDIWGQDMRHDWTTWREVLPHYLRHRF